MDISKTGISISKTQKKHIQQEKISKKKVQEIFLLKTLLSEKIYILIRSICSNNPICSDYISKYLLLFTKHIGYGDFVCITLSSIIASNEKFLEKISNLTVFNQNTSNSMLSKEKLTKKTFIDEIFTKLKTFSSFEKVEIVAFLSSLCHFQENAIYMNQEKIFKNLFYYIPTSSEKEYMFSISCNEKDEILQAQYRINDRKLIFALNELKVAPNLSEKMILFIKNQLRLYARLSMGRNNTSYRHLKKYFPYKILIEKMFDESIDNEMRSIFCQLAKNLYIDAHPKNLLVKPNFIRIVKSSAMVEKKTTVKVKSFSNKGIIINIFGYLFIFL